VRNATFARELGHALNRPARLRAPAALLHRLAGAFADELLIGGQRVLPAKAEDSGFVFRYPALAGALAAMLGAPESASATRAFREGAHRATSASA
jgi:NAD dependent epimerase/dehydratase family enzyme